jgi:hypothetical protein
MKTITDLFKAARRVSTPLISVISPDPAATMRTLIGVVSKETPVIGWNSVKGLAALNDAGKQALSQTFTEDGELEDSWDPVNALEKMERLPKTVLVFFQWLHAYMDEPRVKQAVYNLRDLFKARKQTLIMLAPDFRPALELAGDIVYLEEPLPTDEQLGRILEVQYSCVKGLGEPDPTTTRRSVEALRGLPAFAAEQAIALSMTPEGVDQEQLWHMKRSSIRNVPGLQMYDSKITYEALGGLDAIKRFHKQLFGGRKPPSCVLHIDEIEKALAGIGGAGGGDTSGTSQDQLSVILQYMQDESWTGIILLGAPGTGKTAIATTTGPTFGVPTIRLDLGALKGGLVGQSEAQVRLAMRTIKGIAGDGCYVIATCNSLDRLPPELRRRFNRGIWYVDLPTEEELESIWDINVKKYDLEAGQKRPQTAAYTGADVRNICDNAYSLELPLLEAAQTIVPVSVSDPSSIKRLQDMANGKFLDASLGGPYQKDSRKELTGARGYDFTEE